MALEPAQPGNAGRNDYPRMLYHPDGRTMTVETPAQEDALRAEGWGQRAHAAHHKPQVSASPVMSGGDPMGALIRSVLEAVLDERGLTKELGYSLRTAAQMPEPAAPQIEFPSRSKANGT